MIIKEDTPAVFTGRPLSSPSLPSLPSLPSSSSLGGAHSLPPPPTPTETIPSYRPPSLPPPAHLPQSTPHAVQTYHFPPPRYKYRPRPLRFVPLLLSLALAAVVLGAAVNFLVESVIKISRVHIKPDMFRVFRQILTPTLVLVAGTAFTIVVLPIHHLLPIPQTRKPFRLASHRHRLLVVARLLLPALSTTFYLVGGAWFLSVALVRGDSTLPSTSANGTTTVTIDGLVVGDDSDGAFESGNGQTVHRDPKWPDEGTFWTPWFFADPNVQLVVYSSVLAALASGVYLANAVPGGWVHGVFTGVPPEGLGRWEKRVSGWWGRTVLGRRRGSRRGEREEEEEEEEMEGFFAGDRPADDDDDGGGVGADGGSQAAAAEALDDQTAQAARRRRGLRWAAWDAGTRRRAGLLPFGLSLGRRTGAGAPTTTTAAGGTAGPVAI